MEVKILEVTASRISPWDLGVRNLTVAGKIAKATAPCPRLQVANITVDIVEVGEV